MNRIWPRTQQPDLGGLALLDLDDHVRCREYLFRCVRNVRASGLVDGIREADVDPGVALDNDVVPRPDELAHARRREPDAQLV